jgi:hypothetical protein
MIISIDHLVIACVDPDVAADDLERAVGLAPVAGGRHEALGTYNRLVWFGDSYLELVGIFDRNLAARSWVGAASLSAIDGGGGLATWAVATDAIDQDVARLNAQGANLSVPIDGERRRPDGAFVRWRLAAPRAVEPATLPFLIEHDPTAAEWTAPERVVRAAQHHPLGAPVRLEVLELEVRDVARTGNEFFRTVAIGPFRPSVPGGRTREAPVGEQTIRLSAATRRFASAMWPMATIHLRVLPTASTALPPETRAVELLGCRFVIA